MRRRCNYGEIRIEGVGRTHGRRNSGESAAQNAVGRGNDVDGDWCAGALNGCWSRFKIGERRSSARPVLGNSVQIGSVILQRYALPVQQVRNRNVLPPEG